MKKYITSFVMAAMVAVMIPFMATTTNAQTRCFTNNRGQRVCLMERNDRSFYSKHRNLINIDIGTAAKRPWRTDRR